MQLLETKIILFKKQDGFSKCKNEQGKIKIQECIEGLTLKINETEKELRDLVFNINFERVIKGDKQQTDKLESIINEYINHFENSKTEKAKIEIRKCIGKLLDAQIQEEASYTYGACNNMKDVLTIIRNCFSHIGRIYIGKNTGSLPYIILSDYDNNGEKSGEVICQYVNLIRLLIDPYQIDEPQIKKLVDKKSGIFNP